MGRETAGTMRRGSLLPKRGGAITLKRLNMRSEEVRVLREEVTGWLNKHLNTEMQPPELLLELSDGIRLYNIAEKVNADLLKKMGKLHDNARPKSFFAHENVQRFLKASAQLGVPAFTLFDTHDLLSENPNERAVVLCILALSRVAVKYGLEPPQVVKYEHEIEDILSGKRQLVDPGLSKDEIHQAVQAYCNARNLPCPERILFGEYRFNPNTTAHVRVIRGEPLVRYNNQWEDLQVFILQKLKEDVEASIRTPETKEADPTPAPEPIVEEEVPAPQTPKDAEARRREEMEAKKEFFFLTALAVKMTSELREDMCIVSSADLWEKACEERLSFYEFHDWIKVELRKCVLSNTRKERFKNMDSAGEESSSALREQRANVLHSIQRRHVLQAETAHSSSRS